MGMRFGERLRTGVLLVATLLIWLPVSKVTAAGIMASVHDSHPTATVNEQDPETQDEVTEDPVTEDPATENPATENPATEDQAPTLAKSVTGNEADKEPADTVAGEVRVLQPNPPVDVVTQHGFLPTRGSVMLDFVFLAMLLILPAVQFSILQAKAKRFRLHRNLQIGIAIALLVAVVLFEIDMRFFTDWRQLAAPSPLVGWCPGLLYFHLLFAIPTPFVWAWVIYGALRNFDQNFQGNYVIQHRMMGKIGALLMYATGLTGILFYVVAFVL